DGFPRRRRRDRRGRRRRHRRGPAGGGPERHARARRGAGRTPRGGASRGAVRHDGEGLVPARRGRVRRRVRLPGGHSVTRVLIVEDHAVFRAGLRALLATAPEFELVGETDSGREAVRLASELAPDLIVMDLQLPDMNGVEATSLITRDAPGARVLVLTMYDDDRSEFEAIRAGALGYALKGSAPEALLRAMQAVTDGEASFSAAIATRIQRYFAARVAGEGILFEELTEREHEVLAAV